MKDKNIKNLLKKLKTINPSKLSSRELLLVRNRLLYIRYQLQRVKPAQGKGGLKILAIRTVQKLISQVEAEAFERGLLSSAPKRNIPNKY